MTDTKWTPGPWSVSTYGDMVMGPDGHSGAICKMFSKHGPYPDYKSNRHLIAAAPELYEALEPLDEWATEHVVEAKEWSPKTTVQIQLSIGELRAARAALAKARGEGQ